jgi:ssDNA-binding Zn-finger/Zn-ribbon topoisomerase 1
MRLFPEEQCRTNKMLWLSEDKERALSYGSSLKTFMTKSDIDLWDLTGPVYPFQIKDADVEFKGKMNNIMNLFGPGDLSMKANSLYSFLTGSGSYNVEKQLALLKAIHSEIEDDADLVFDGKTAGQTIMTPDAKSFKDVVQEYIKIGDELGPVLLGPGITNQRLSVYGLDQILLKMMCLNETDERATKQGVKGWIVPQGTQTVWAEFVDGVQVSDMGELALFDCSNLIACGEEKKAQVKKRKKTKKTKRKQTKKSKRKQTKKTKKRKKSKRTKKRIRRNLPMKRLTRRGKAWAKSMSNYMSDL